MGQEVKDREMIKDRVTVDVSQIITQFRRECDVLSDLTFRQFNSLVDRLAHYVAGQYQEGRYNGYESRRLEEVERGKKK